MTCHRIRELLELLESEWNKDQQLNLIPFIIQLAKEAGYQGPIQELTDDVLIYHLKMRNSPTDEMIPGLRKDQELDFKSALLKARGVID
ncbi:YihD family protein [Vibrio hepatarius]|uniref:YihD family protein n=1 Tax=Vibrio hepatarius TaxID=171383 RepID=UPI001C0958E2|nr:YihD family protein [Vibrio hepatarius]MBU2897622.1 YihD family protein [Vibrio hepatarius]